MTDALRWHWARDCPMPIGCALHKEMWEAHIAQRQDQTACPNTCMFCYPEKEVRPTLAQQHRMAHDRGICGNSCPICPPHVVSSLAETLEARGEQYGDFSIMAAVAQNIKLSMRSGAMWPSLASHEQESLEEIATKIARIVCGAPGQRDSWHDIGGYAKLSEDRSE